LRTVFDSFFDENHPWVIASWSETNINKTYTESSEKYASIEEKKNGSDKGTKNKRKKGDDEEEVKGGKGEGGTGGGSGQGSKKKARITK